MFSDYWLGGRDDVIEGFWQWSSTGENFTVSDWAPGEPDDAANSQDCLLIWKAANYQWDDQQCTINYRYICESEYVYFFIKQLKSKRYSVNGVCEDMIVSNTNIYEKVRVW